MKTTIDTTAASPKEHKRKGTDTSPWVSSNRGNNRKLGSQEKRKKELFSSYKKVTEKLQTKQNNESKKSGCKNKESGIADIVTKCSKCKELPWTIRNKSKKNTVNSEITAASCLNSNLKLIRLNSCLEKLKCLTGKQPKYSRFTSPTADPDLFYFLYSDSL